MKNIIYATKDLFKNYFNWHGRLSRAGYLWAWAGVLAVSAVLIFLGKAVSFSALMPYRKLMSEITTHAARIWNLAVFLPILFATIRRYHDSGKAGWKAVIYSTLGPVFIAWACLIGMFLMIAFVFGGGYMITAEADVKFARLLGIAVLTALLFFVGIAFCVLNIIHIFRRSDPGENKYGKPMPFPPSEGA